VSWHGALSRVIRVRAVAFCVRGAVSGHAAAVVHVAWTLPNASGF